MSRFDSDISRKLLEYSRATPLGATLRQILRGIMQNLNIAEKRRENFYERRAIILPSLYRTSLCNSKMEKVEGMNRKMGKKRNLLLKAYIFKKELRRRATLDRRCCLPVSVYKFSEAPCICTF